MGDYKEEKSYEKVLVQTENYAFGMAVDGADFKYYNLEDLDNEGKLKADAVEIPQFTANVMLSRGKIMVARCEESGVMIPFSVQFDGEKQTVFSASELRQTEMEKPVEPKKPGWGTWAGFWHNLLGVKTQGWKQYEGQKAVYDEELMKFDQLEKLKSIKPDKITDIAEQYEQHKDEKIELDGNLKIGKEEKIKERQRAAEKQPEAKPEKVSELPDRDAMVSKFNTRIYEQLVHKSDNALIKKFVTGGYSKSAGNAEQALNNLCAEDLNLERMTPEKQEELKKQLNDYIADKMPGLEKELLKSLEPKKNKDGTMPVETEEKIRQREQMKAALQDAVKGVTGDAVLERMKSAQFASIERLKASVPKEKWPETEKEKAATKQSEWDKRMADSAAKEEARKAAELTDQGTKIVDDARKGAYQTLMDDKASPEQVSHAMATIMACSPLKKKSEYETERLEMLKLGMGKMPEDPERREEVRQNTEAEMAKNAENRYKIGKNSQLLDEAISKVENDPKFQAGMDDPKFVMKHKALLCAKHMENEIFKRADHYDETKQMAMSVQEGKLVAEVQNFTQKKMENASAGKVVEATHTNQNDKSIGAKEIGAMQKK